MKRTDVVVGERYAVDRNKGVAKLGRGWLVEAEVLSAEPGDTYRQYWHTWGTAYGIKRGVRVLLIERNEEVVLPARSIAGLWSEEEQIRADRKKWAEERDKAWANNEVRTAAVLEALKERGHNPYWYPTYKNAYEVSLDILEDLLGLTTGKGEEK